MWKILASFHYERRFGFINPATFFEMPVSQARRVSGHVYICIVVHCILFLQLHFAAVLMVCSILFVCLFVFVFFLFIITKRKFFCLAFNIKLVLVLNTLLTHSDLGVKLTLWIAVRIYIKTKFAKCK